FGIFDADQLYLFNRIAEDSAVDTQALRGQFIAGTDAEIGTTAPDHYFFSLVASGIDGAGAIRRGHEIETRRGRLGGRRCGGAIGCSRIGRSRSWQGLLSFLFDGGN